MREENSLLDRFTVQARNALRPSRIIRQVHAYQPTARGLPKAKLKIEVNCNERRPVHEIVDLDYAVPNIVPGVDTVTLRTYDINEMLGTKMRALHQRTHGRDLFDLWWALTWTDDKNRHPTDPDLIVAIFEDYMRREGDPVDADAYQIALDAKVANPAFALDVTTLIRPGLEPTFDLEQAAEVVRNTVIAAMRRREAGLTP